ncbi:hypothetical protein AAHH80_34035, partial [Burkholderia pseudomallei]
MSIAVLVDVVVVVYMILELMWFYIIYALELFLERVLDVDVRRLFVAVQVLLPMHCVVVRVSRLVVFFLLRLGGEFGV